MSNTEHGTEEASLSKKLLEKTLELLADPAHWTQYAGAKDKHGYHSLISDENAVCWCMIGGMSKIDASIESRSDEFYSAQMAVVTAIDNLYPDNLFGESIIAFNDDPNRKHHEVVQVLSAAIELLS